MEEERRKLEQMISDGESYEKILKQSQILDKYISIEIKKIYCNK